MIRTHDPSVRAGEWNVVHAIECVVTVSGEIGTYQTVNTGTAKRVAVVEWGMAALWPWENYNELGEWCRYLRLLNGSLFQEYGDCRNDGSSCLVAVVSTPFFHHPLLLFYLFFSPWLSLKSHLFSLAVFTFTVSLFPSKQPLNTPYISHPLFLPVISFLEQRAF
jgi:hypothetical protein